MNAPEKHPAESDEKNKPVEPQYSEPEYDHDDESALADEFDGYEVRMVGSASSDSTRPTFFAGGKLTMAIVGIALLVAFFLSVHKRFFSEQDSSAERNVKEYVTPAEPASPLAVREPSELPSGEENGAVTAIGVQIKRLGSDDPVEQAGGIDALSKYFYASVPYSVGRTSANALVNLFLEKHDKGLDKTVMKKLVDALGRIVSVGMTRRFVPNEAAADILKIVTTIYEDANNPLRHNAVAVILGLKFNDAQAADHGALLKLLSDPDRRVGEAVSDWVNEWLVSGRIGVPEAYEAAYHKSAPDVRQNILSIYRNVDSLRVAEVLRGFYFREKDSSLRLAIGREIAFLSRFRDSRLVLLDMAVTGDAAQKKFAQAELKLWHPEKFYDQDTVFRNANPGDWVVYWREEKEKRSYLKQTILTLGQEGGGDAGAAKPESVVQMKLEDYDPQTKKTSNLRVKSVSLSVVKEYEAEMPTMPDFRTASWGIEKVKVGGREVFCEVLSGKDRQGRAVKLWMSDALHFRAGLVREEVDGRVTFGVMEFGGND